MFLIDLLGMDLIAHVLMFVLFDFAFVLNTIFIL